jgi:hypothetical protein
MYKARSITNKASSACKMNMALIEGEREVDKVMSKKVGFNEAAEGAMGALGGDKKQAPAADKGDSNGGGQSGGAIDVTEDTAPAPAPKMRRSPAKLDPMTIMKVASMASSAMGSKKKGGDGGGKQETKVVVNNASAAPASSGSNSQASNAIDPK